MARSFNVVLERSAAAVDDASRVVGCRTTGGNVTEARYESGRKRQGLRGPHLTPLGLFLRTYILFTWRILSAFLPA